MNEAVAKELLNWLQGTRTFVLEQAPDLAKEIVAWGRVESALGILLGLIILGGASILGYWGRKIWLKDNWADCLVLFWIFGVILGTVGVAVTLCNFSNFAEATFAPKIYLLEYLGHLLKAKG